MGDLSLSGARPTHTLTIAVPLNLEANPAAEDYDIQGAMAEAMQVILPVIRVGTLGLICDQIIVTMHESEAPQSEERAE